MNRQTSPNPLLFTVVTLPFGLTNGFVSVTLGYLVTRAGASLADAAALAALAVAPRLCSVLWAPVVDLTWSHKRWYLLCCTTAALAIAAAGLVPVAQARMGLLSAMVLVSAVATSSLAMVAESLLAHASGPATRGRLAAWFQVGAVGGVGLGGGASLWLAERTGSPLVAALVLATLIVFCQFALLGIPSPSTADRGSLRDGLRHLARDVGAVAKARGGQLAALMFILPIGSGAAANLWAPIAADYRVGAGTVALVTGGASGIASVAGALAGGPLCDRINRFHAYLLISAFFAAITAVMALAPPTPIVFVVCTLIYAFANGMAYTAFAALVLETIGSGAVATKYNLFLSVVYAPIVYMTAIEGGIHDRWGRQSMLWAETVLALAAMAIVLIMRRIASGGFGQRDVREIA